MYQNNADPTSAEPIKAYMRNQFEYLGIKMPLQRELQRNFIADYGLPDLSDLPQITLALWDMPEREYQYAGISILGKLEKKLPDDY